MDKQRKILILAGDGIGPEVCNQARKVLELVNNKYDLGLILQEGLVGGSAYEKTGKPLPEETLRLAKDSHAILLGAVGGPQWDNLDYDKRPERALLGLRSELELFANLRPAVLFKELTASSSLKPQKIEGLDLLIVRELTGGIYFGEKQRNESSASDLCIYHDYEVERIIRFAANLAKIRRNKLCSVDKANVLETSRLWRDVTTKIMASEFESVDIEHILVDAAAMYLISRPADFDVIVTENMFGDILTDEASMLSGSMGMLPSASLGDGAIGLYEPIHGSAPDIAGKGIANPCGMIGSVALLLRHSLNLHEEAALLEKAIYDAIENGARTLDIATNNEKILDTEEMTQVITNYLVK